MMRRVSDNGGFGGWGGDAYPGQEPEAEAVARDYSDSMGMSIGGPKEYKWALTGSHISVSDDYDHANLFAGMGHGNWAMPHAWGTVEVDSEWTAKWTIEGSTMALHTVEQRLRRYSRDQGWKHVSIMENEPGVAEMMKVAEAVGVGDGNYPDKLWNTDPEGDVDPGNFAGFADPTDDEQPEGPMVCSECGEPFPDYRAWLKHVDRVHHNPQREPSPTPQPVVDLDQPIPAQFNIFNDNDQTIMRQSAHEMRTRYAATQELIQGPMPFVYDIESDRIYVGHPGGKHSDIKGQFTPGGVVEGMYMPDGKLQFRTDTDMPYTLYHVVDLWYAMHPELAVKSIYKLEDGKPYKLASSNIAHRVRNLVATNDAAWNALHALRDLGNVYAVADLVEDVIAGAVPERIAFVVQGAESIRGPLEILPGFVEEAGGYLRYTADDGSSVEVEVPQDPYAPIAHLAVNLNTVELYDPADEVPALKTISRNGGFPQSVEVGEKRKSGLRERITNILDEIHQTLDPTVWNNAGSKEPTLRPEIADWITSHVAHVMTQSGWPDPVDYLTLVVTGSLTTYQWSPKSDFDVSLWVDVQRFPDFARAELISTMIEHIDGTVVPGTSHPIQCFVVNSEKFTPEDLYRPGLRSGYDIKAGKWIVPPERSRSHDVAREYPEYLAYAHLLADKIRLMLKYEPDMVKPVWDAFHRQRHDDQTAGKGDFSQSNIALKYLENVDLLPAIAKATGERIASTEPLNVKLAELIREASWADVADKAKRLVQTGDVTILTNRPNYVGAIVKGDHGTYQTEISRHDPDSQVIEQWGCTCPWSQYAFDRTRKWKKLEGRPCSHVMAVYWKARSTPLDITGEQPGYQAPRGQMRSPAGPGQMEIGEQPPALQTAPPAEQIETAQPLVPGEQIEQPAPAPTPPVPTQPTMQDLAIPQQPAWALQQQQQQRQGPQRRPQQAPMRGQLQLWDTQAPWATGQPVPPDPNAPPTVLFPGAMSKVYVTNRTAFVRYAKHPLEDWAQELLSRGRMPIVQVVHPNVHLEQRGGKIPVPGAEPIGFTKDGLPKYQTVDLGWDPVLRRRVNADEGTAGAPEQRGVFSPVKPGSRAELRAVEPLLGMAHVVIPMGDSGPLHPHSLAGWVDYNDLVPTANQRTPFRA